jgi:hypothetical protein
MRPVADLWSEDKQYTRSDWKYEVCNDATNLGYWEWVANQKSMAEAEQENIILEPIDK